jgi:hypothetical protein
MAAVLGKSVVKMVTTYDTPFSRHIYFHQQQWRRCGIANTWPRGLLFTSRCLGPEPSFSMKPKRLPNMVLTCLNRHLLKRYTSSEFTETRQVIALWSSIRQNGRRSWRSTLQTPFLSATLYLRRSTAEVPSTRRSIPIRAVYPADHIRPKSRDRGLSSLRAHWRRS